MTAVPCKEMVGSVWPTTLRVHLCAGCHRPVVEIAEGCWMRTEDRTAQCPAGGLHKVAS